jgi:hypothetical protein
MKLRTNEYCPIHRSRFCCGREQARKDRRFNLGVQRIEDPHHPRGYRELRSPAEMRKVLNRKIGEQDGKCAICHASFTDYTEIVPDHIEPKGMGGAWRDDHPENVQAVHRRCNFEKGYQEGQLQKAPYKGTTASSEATTEGYTRDKNSRRQLPRKQSQS